MHNGSDLIQVTPEPKDSPLAGVTPAFTLRVYPHPDLRAKANAVGFLGPDGPDPEKLDHIAEMLNGLRAGLSQFGGIGLAGNQLGILERLVVTAVNDQVREWVNPGIQAPSDEPMRLRSVERCLSLPGAQEEVPRWRTVTVTYQDRLGEPHSEVVDGPLAVVLQHEVDHLNGVLFIDYLPLWRRRIQWRRVQREWRHLQEVAQVARGKARRR